jgi:dihydroorotate dehydrogenase (fumarate)
MNAAGTVKTVDQATEALRSAAGAVMLGSFTLHERSGNDGQTYHYAGDLTLNSAGLPSPGVEVWSRIVRDVAERATDLGKLVWVSVAGFSAKECLDLIDVAVTSGADVVEANLGCPNVWSDGAQKPILSYDLESVEEILSGLTARPTEATRIGMKLSPILDGRLLSALHSLIRNSSCISFITAINTIPNCFAFTEAGGPAISYGSGLAGMGGPATKSIALGQILQHRAGLADLPLVAVGGITRGVDVRHFLDASVGATLCQTASAYYERGPACIGEILQDFVALAG